MTQQELKEILRNHKLWLENCDQQDAVRADLCFADLRCANLCGADLRGAKNVPFVPYTCPDFGSFIGYKKRVV